MTIGVDLAHAHLGKPKFEEGEVVEFTTTCYLDFYQEREEEVRSREVKKRTKGTVKRIIPQSTTWNYAVHLENTEYAWVEAPEIFLRWYDTYYDEEARSIIWNEKLQKLYDLYIEHSLAFLNNTKIKHLRRDEDGECVEYEAPDENVMRAVENAIDIPETHAYDFRQAVVTQHNGRLKLSGYTPRWHEDAAMHKALPVLLKQMEADWKKNPTVTTIKNIDKCTCSIDTLMSSGCQCGHLEKKHGKS